MFLVRETWMQLVYKVLYQVSRTSFSYEKLGPSAISFIANMSGLDWPLCNGTAHLDEHRRHPRKKMKCFEGTCSPGNVESVLCISIVTVKTRVLWVRTKKGRQLFCIPEFAHPFPHWKKILRAPVTAADGTAPKTPPVRLCNMF